MLICRPEERTLEGGRRGFQVHTTRDARTTRCMSLKWADEHPVASLAFFVLPSNLKYPYGLGHRSGVSGSFFAIFSLSVAGASCAGTKAHDRMKPPCIRDWPDGPDPLGLFPSGFHSNINRPPPCSFKEGPKFLPSRSTATHPFGRRAVI
eukprot:scaffold6_cov245-Pinguiococcus_pyrenoidosus.AAC.9